MEAGRKEEKVAVRAKAEVRSQKSEVSQRSEVRAGKDRLLPSENGGTRSQQRRETSLILVRDCYSIARLFILRARRLRPATDPT
jgi:hypothetical protein